MNGEGEEALKLSMRERGRAAVWWFLFVGLPAAIVTLIATVVVDLSDREVHRLVYAVALVCAGIGFVYGRRLPGLPWANGG
jgi:hypothetical protein